MALVHGRDALQALRLREVNRARSFATHKSARWTLTAPTDPIVCESWFYSSARLASGRYFPKGWHLTHNQYRLAVGAGMVTGMVLTVIPTIDQPTTRPTARFYRPRVLGLALLGLEAWLAAVTTSNTCTQWQGGARRT
jgi:hypothetical protein